MPVITAFLVLCMFACDDEMDISGVTVDGVIYQTNGEANIFVDIAYRGSPLYRLSPTINGVPMTNVNQSERYQLDPAVGEFRYDSTYVLEVEIENTVVTDTLSTPGEFRLNTGNGDTLATFLGAVHTVTWNSADTASLYFIELVYTGPNGQGTVLRQQTIGQDTTYTLPTLDGYGTYRLDVYAYRHAVYHPSRGYLTGYTTPAQWVVDGAWSAWVRRSVVFWVPIV